MVDEVLCEVGSDDLGEFIGGGDEGWAGALGHFAGRVVVMWTL